MIFTIIIASLYGLAIGSFLNAVVYRVPLKESLNTRSHCPKCNATIKGKHNIPVISWLFLRGKCNDCGNPIHWRYPAVELAGAAAFAAVALFVLLKYQETLASQILLMVGLASFAAGSIALTLIDLKHKLLPNAVVYPTGLLTIIPMIAASLVVGDYGQILRAFIGAALFFSVLFLIWFVKPGAMGFGDVRLAFILGFVTAWFTFSQVVFAFFATFLVASVFSVGLLLRKNANKKTAIPFGPWLFVGTWGSILAGAPIIDIYLRIGGLR